MSFSAEKNQWTLSTSYVMRTNTATDCSSDENSLYWKRGKAITKGKQSLRKMRKLFGWILTPRECLSI